MSNSLIWDLIFLTITVFIIGTAAWKGVFRICAGLISTVGAAIAAMKITPKVEGFLAQALRPVMNSAVEKAAENLGFTEMLSEEITSSNMMALKELLIDLNIGDPVAWARQAADAGAEMQKSAASALASTISPIIAFIVIFLVVKLVIRAIIELCSLDIPLLSALNGWMGAACGAVGTAAFVLLVCHGIYTYAPEVGGFLSKTALFGSVYGKFAAAILGV